MKKIFTIYDCKAEAYLDPFYMQSTGLALRSFAEAAHHKETPIGKYPADFTLFEKGTWDEQTDKETYHKAKINLGTALEARTPLPTFEDNLKSIQGGE